MSKIQSDTKINLINDSIINISSNILKIYNEDITTKQTKNYFTQSNVLLKKASKDLLSLKRQ